jgi:high-affinity iron transporter
MNKRTPFAAGILLSLLLGRVASPATAGDVETGKAVYRARCAFCHGMTGHGDGTAGTSLRPPPTDFTHGGYWRKATPASMKAVIDNGRPGTAMVAFKDTLSETERATVLVYLETFKPGP